MINLTNSSIEHWFREEFLPRHNNTLIGVPFSKALEELNKDYYGDISYNNSDYLQSLYDKEILQGPEGYFG